MILAVSHREDVHAAPVIEALSRLGWRCELLDLAALPREVALSISAGRAASGARFVGVDGTLFEAGEIEAVWWRRPRPYLPHDGLASPVAGYASLQLHAAVSGVWGSLRAGWMNDPWMDERANHKPIQLAAAEAAGLTVPPTLITCVPADARAFLEELGPRAVVQKALRPTEASWQPTRLLREADRGRLDDLRFAPVILQAYVPGLDVRVTAAGGRLFATAIDARQTSSPHDFRPALAQARVEPCELPEEVAAGVKALLRTLGLRYAAIDFRLTDEGQWFFLESNPAGQWLFLEERTGQPITRGVAQALVDAALEARAGAPSASSSIRRPPAQGETWSHPC